MVQISGHMSPSLDCNQFKDNNQTSFVLIFFLYYVPNNYLSCKTFPRSTGYFIGLIGQCLFLGLSYPLWFGKVSVSSTKFSNGSVYASTAEAIWIKEGKDRWAQEDQDVICIQLAYDLCHLFSRSNFQVRAASLLSLCHHAPIPFPYSCTCLIYHPLIQILYLWNESTQNSGNHETDQGLWGLWGIFMERHSYWEIPSEGVGPPAQLSLQFQSTSWALRQPQNPCLSFLLSSEKRILSWLLQNKWLAMAKKFAQFLSSRESGKSHHPWFFPSP